MEKLYLYNGNLVAQLVAKKLKTSYVMGDENTYISNDHMCQCYTLVTK